MHPLDLTRRERQIMHVVYRRGEATAAEVQQAIADAPAYSGVRTLLRVLVDKGHLEIRRDGARYVYRPTAPRHDVRRTALRELVRTFFDGSPEQAMLALLDDRESIDAVTERRLRKLIAEVKRKP